MCEKAADTSNEFISPSQWASIDEDDRCAIAKEVKKDCPELNELPIGFKESFYTRHGKRALDLLVGVPALIVTLPINALLAVVTFVDVGSPIFFVQERIGKDGKPFKLVKFRNMTNETNEEGVLLQPEKRVTRWGKFTRSTSLDELMNLWSVVKGDMSIIGPRPLPMKYGDRFSDYHIQRQLVRPGLECPFHSKELSGTGWQGRLDNDVWYVENISFATDVKLFALLIKKVFSKEERAASAAGKTGEFIGYYPDGSVMNEWGIPIKYLNIITRRSNSGGIDK